MPPDGLSRILATKCFPVMLLDGPLILKLARRLVWKFEKSRRPAVVLLRRQCLEFFSLALKPFLYCIWVAHESLADFTFSD